MKPSNEVTDIKTYIFTWLVSINKKFQKGLQLLDQLSIESLSNVAVLWHFLQQNLIVSLTKDPKLLPSMTSVPLPTEWPI